MVGRGARGSRDKCGNYGLQDLMILESIKEDTIVTTSLILALVTIVATLIIGSITTYIAIIVVIQSVEDFGKYKNLKNIL